MPKPSVRDELITQGARVMQERGYHATSVSDIAAAAGAPKGSFYNHFQSKEAFAQAVLGAYYDMLGPVFEATIGNPALSGADRLEALSDALIAHIRAAGWSGCLLGNFALDATQETDALRREVNAMFATWRGRMRAAIAAGQADGSLRANLAPDDAAGWYISAWEGAALRYKALRDPAPLYEFQRAARAMLAP